MSRNSLSVAQVRERICTPVPIDNALFQAIPVVDPRSKAKMLIKPPLKNSNKRNLCEIFLPNNRKQERLLSQQKKSPNIFVFVLEFLSTLATFFVSCAKTLP